MIRPEVEIVRAGYDAMAGRYLTWAAATDDPSRARLVADLDALLPTGSAVLDLGCGNGRPSTAFLAQRHAVVGVDVSGEQIALARQHVPDARFECTDLLDLQRPAGSVDAVLSLYALTHVPRDLHAELLGRIHSWLRPGGLLLVTMSAHGTSDVVQDDFIGVPMYFSGYPADENRRLVRSAGFELIVDDVTTLQEPDGVAEFLWVLARSD